MTVLATVIVLGVLIFVHELGHFGAAKAVGVEVQRFSIGLGPKIFGFTWGETEYVISLIPLGGYVKMGGMDDEVMEKLEGGAEAAPREPGPRDFDSKPIWARTFVISAGVIMNMLFAFGVYTFVIANWGLTELGTTRIARVDVDALPQGTEALSQVVEGSRVVRIGDTPVEKWGDFQAGLFRSDPGAIQIEFVDPVGTIDIRIPADEDARRALALAVLDWRDAAVGVVNPGSPAAKADLEPGDLITSVEGSAVAHWYDFVDEIERRPGEEVELTLVREGRQMVRAVTLDSEEEEQPDGSSLQVGKIGIYPAPGEIFYTEASFGESIKYGYRETVAVAGLIVGFLGDLVTGGISPRSVGSIVTIGEASGQAAAAGLDTFLRFMALFSVNLAVLNLLPIPVLDGGHLVFLGIEAIRGGRGLTLEQKIRWSNVGLLVVVGIMVWALSNDFLRLLGI